MNETIIQTALQLFLKSGIKKTSMEDVAEECGLTRVTIYRQFGDKKNLVREAIMLIPKKISGFSENKQYMHTETSLLNLHEIFSTLPEGNITLLLMEVKKLYPQLYVEFHEARYKGINSLFTRIFNKAEEEGRLREGINRDLTGIFFSEFVIKVMESPKLRHLMLSTGELFSSVEDLFLYGIFKQDDEEQSQR